MTPYEAVVGGQGAEATATPETRPGPLTKRQATLFRFVYEQTWDRGYQPSFREITDHFGIASRNGVGAHLRTLERKGWIELRLRANRAVIFLRRPAGSAFEGFGEKGGVN